MCIKNNVLSVLMTISILTSPLLFAADHTDMSYQGLLTDASGNPVADGTHDIVFSIWDDSISGTQQWTEAKSVQTNSGMFNTMLQNPFGFLFGVDTPPSDGPFFLQIQIGADPPASPRSRMGTVFGSMLTQRIEGDVFTSPGEMQILPAGADPQGGLAAITLKTDDNENVISVGSVLSSLPAIHIRTDSNESSFRAETGNGLVNRHRWSFCTDRSKSTLELCWPSSTEDSLPDITLEANDDENVISVWSAGDPSLAMQMGWTHLKNEFNMLSSVYMDAETPEETQHCVYLATTQIQNILTIDWFPLPDGEPSAATLKVDSIQSSLGLRYNDDAGSSGLPQINLTSTAAASSFTMKGPDPGAALFNGVSITADVSEARMGINTDSPTSALYVDGDIVATGAITELSDMRLKENVTDIEDALVIINEIRGVQFEWRKDQRDFADLPDGKRVGLIAQEIEKVLPEAVLSPKEGYKSVDYSRLTPVLVQAIKEQQKQIDELKELVYQLSKGSKEQTDR